MSRHIAKLFTRPLALTATALVLHVGAATAADSEGDIQQQVREVLTGTATTHFVPQSATHDGKVTPPAVDSQEFAKRLLLGAAASRVGGPETSKHAEVSAASRATEAPKRPGASIDIQAAVQKMLLGQPHASDAS
jgi:ABC-type amino acid transport substrate-binding protein